MLASIKGETPGRLAFVHGSASPSLGLAAMRKDPSQRKTCPMTAPHSDALVLFGVTGDLANKMIFPASMRW